MTTSKIGAVEVFVVLGVIAVLAAIVVPNYIRPRTNGSLSTCKSNLKNIGTSLEMYSIDWDGKYPSSLAALTPNYLKVIPECSMARTDTYSRTYDSSPKVTCRTHSDDNPSVECTEKRNGLEQELNGKTFSAEAMGVYKKRKALCPGSDYEYTIYQNFYSYGCGGHNHGAVDLEPGYPKYDAVGGLIERQW